MFIPLYIAQLIGNELGFANAEFRNIAVMVSIRSIGYIGCFNQVIQLHRKSFIQHIAFVLFGVV